MNIEKHILMAKLLSLIFITNIIVLTGCAPSQISKTEPLAAHQEASSSVSNEYHIMLSYKDFGPEAESLLGVHHWQWDDVENRKPVKYDIKVIVYRNTPLDEITNRFPVIPETHTDYRYIEYSEARKFIDSRIQDMYTYLELPGAIDNADNAVFLMTIISLYQTGLKIERALRK